MMHNVSETNYPSETHYVSSKINMANYKILVCDWSSVCLNISHLIDVHVAMWVSSYNFL